MRSAFSNSILSDEVWLGPMLNGLFVELLNFILIFYRLVNLKRQMGQPHDATSVEFCHVVSGDNT